MPKFQLSLIIALPIAALFYFSSDLQAGSADYIASESAVQPVVAAESSLSQVERADASIISPPALMAMDGQEDSAVMLSAGRGYLTSAADLGQIRQLAEQGVEPHTSNVSRLLEFAGAPGDWQYGTVSGRFSATVDHVCVSESQPGGDRFIRAEEGGHEVYRKMLAYHLTGDLAYAESAREKVLDLTDTYGFGGHIYDGGNECILHLAFSIPLWIQTADLLEGTPVWSAEDRIAFQNWLAGEVYTRVAWASRVRTNNWGSAGSLTASMIADYVGDRDLLLREEAPVLRNLSPAEAFREHNQMQLDRMNGLMGGDSRCNSWGIRSDGGIPDELRRGATGCDGQWIVADDSSLSYQVAHVEHLVFHAEFLSRRGDGRLFANISSEGKGSILRAIHFVIANPNDASRSVDWVNSRKGTLFVAYTHYHDQGIAAAAASIETFKGGSMLAYAPLTHPLEGLSG